KPFASEFTTFLADGGGVVCIVRLFGMRTLIRVSDTLRQNRERVKQREVVRGGTARAITPVRRPTLRGMRASAARPVRRFARERAKSRARIRPRRFRRASA